MERSRSDLSTALLGVSVLGSALAVGSVHVVSVLVIAPLPVIAALILLQSKQGSVPRVPRPAVILMALAAYSLVQIIPLPASVLAWFAPRNAELWSGSLAVLDAKNSWAPISLDPGATAVEALKWTSYGAAFCCAAMLARAVGRDRVLLITFWSGLAISVVTLTHKLLGLSELYGFYSPEFARPSFALSPFLNSNNLAAYLNLCAFAGLGLLVSRRSTPRRWFLGLGVSVIVGVSGLSASRAGWLTLLLGMALLSVVLLLARSGRNPDRRAWFLLPLAPLVGGVVLFVLGATRDAWSALLEEGLTKLEVISWSGPMITDHIWLGVGRGAFETVFPAYRQDLGHHLYAYAENFIAQWSAEWGAIVALPSLALLAWYLNPVRLGIRRSPAAATVYVGLTVFLLHNLLDLALELLAVGLAVFSVAGALWGAAPSRSAGRAEASGPFARACLVGLTGLTLLLATATGTRPAIAERRTFSDRVQRAAELNQAQQRQLLAEIGNAVRRHPADPFLPLLAAITAHRAGADALPWLGRAIERDPLSGRPHLILAHVLRSRGRHAQALLAIRMAVEREFALTGRGAELALSISSQMDELLEAVPTGASGVTLLVDMARRSSGHAELRARLLDEAILRNAGAAAALKMRTEDLLALMKAQKCDSCARRVRELVEMVERAQPDSAGPPIYHARLLSIQGHDADAEQLLARRCKPQPEHLECLRLRVEVANRLPQPELLRQAVAGYMEVACATARGCGSSGVWMGDRLAQRGDWEGAARTYELAAQQSNDPKTWEQLAKAATHAGNDSLALKAWRKAGVHRKAP